MRKQDVQLSYHQGTAGLPMVNVKIDRWPSNRQEVAQKAALDNGAVDAEAESFAEWVNADDQESTLNVCTEWACESGWEMAQSEAEEVYFSRKPKIESAGRSGGWLVMRGLPEVESWDAAMVSRWFKFAKAMREMADNVPFDTYQLAYINQWEVERRRRVEVEAAREQAGRAMLAGLGVTA